MARSWARFILPVAVVVGGAAWCVRSSSPPGAVAVSPTPSGPPVALLDGLRPGDVVAGWTVDRMFVNESPWKTPQLAIELGRAGAGMTVWVHRKEAAQNAPVTTDRYALTYGHPRPTKESVPQEELTKAMDALAARVRKNEATAPLPPGL